MLAVTIIANLVRYRSLAPSAQHVREVEAKADRSEAERIFARMREEHARD